MTMRRGAYTLIEVLLAVAISSVLLAALYAALSLQIRGMNTGRGLVEQTAIVRSLFSRLDRDVSSSINLVDPARFRNLAATQAAAEAAATGMPATGATGMTGMGGMTGMTGMTGTGGMTGMSGMTGRGGMTGMGGMGGLTGATGMGGTTGMASGTGMGTGMGTTPPAEGGDPLGSGSASINGIPLGVMGDSSTLHLFASKVPTEVYKGELVSDVRRISYWLGGQNGGLCRAEVKVSLSEEARALGVPEGDESEHLLAPEVTAVAFQYFDGSGWQESWDSSQIGSDNATPIGPPRAIAIKLTIQPPPISGTPQPTKTYRHVVVIPTANGQAMSTGGD
jgi:prepilin-type N-terminal cleavage/methylation domain-containing protein